MIKILLYNFIDYFDTMIAFILEIVNSFRENIDKN